MTQLLFSETARAPSKRVVAGSNPAGVARLSAMFRAALAGWRWAPIDGTRRELAHGDVIAGHRRGTAVPDPITLPNLSGPAPRAQGDPI